jgi:SAM-dependent methyltransferase
MDEGARYLNDLTWAYRASRTLQVACLLKIFTHLADEPADARELAGRCKAPAEKLEKLMIACCGIDLLHKEKGIYRNTELSDIYLVEGRPLYQGHIILHALNVWDVWTELPSQLLNDPAAALGSQQENFILGMHNLTMGGRGELFLKAADLSGRRQLLDLGGGPGTYSVLACQNYPELRSTLLDLPETIAIAKPLIEKARLLDRITLREGSWDDDDYGGGFDAVLMSNILHGPESGAAAKLKKAYKAMAPGGLLIIQEFLLDDTKTGPAVPALFNVMVGAYSRPELLAVLQEAGFAEMQITVRDDSIGSTWLTAAKAS